MIGAPGDKIVEISWIATPFRAERFLELWGPAAEAALDYGASAQVLLRSKTDPSKFLQLAAFPDKVSFERYWLSEEIAEIRAELSGCFGLPVYPAWHEISVAGERTLETS